MSQKAVRSKDTSYWPLPTNTNIYTAAAKLMYIELPMYLFFYGAWALILMLKFITRAIEGVGPKNRYYFGPWQLAKRVALCAQKSRWSLYWICPHQNHYVPRQINNRYTCYNSKASNENKTHIFTVIINK